MEFEQFKDEAANYLEGAGIAFNAQMDNFLWSLWNRGVKPHEVVQAYEKQKTEPTVQELLELAKAEGLTFVGRTAGQYTTSTVSQEALVSMMRKAIDLAKQKQAASA